MEDILSGKETDVTLTKDDQTFLGEIKKESKEKQTNKLFAYMNTIHWDKVE
ncbi:hypothetical protein HHU12_33765, partial [Flammeovirga aprica JL-4]|nr:hypothetical protein [Flammeovirga aprica JL-4]